MNISELKRRPTREVVALADDLGVPDAAALPLPQLLLRVGQAAADRGETVVGDGVLELTPQGHGFLRSPHWSYRAGPDDVYVSPAQVRRFGLRMGDTVVGPVRVPRAWEKYLALVHVESINGLPPEVSLQRGEFDALRPRYPDERLRLESRGGGLAMRVVDLFTPIGKGQRGLIVAPPRAGKTILLHQIARALVENHPEVTTIILLIDERPEEVTDFRQSVPEAEVVASTFDEAARRHVAVADLVIERARRLVEAGRDVVILLDSITRLARAHNTVAPQSGKILSGGVEAGALAKPKRFFGAARKIDGGGSLTIVATALVETGSRMDEVIFEEFKGTGNMELVLDRGLANRRVFPAVDLFRSGTRRDELLLSVEERNRVALLRHVLSAMPEEEATPFLLRRMKETATNAEFFRAMVEGR